MQTPHCASNQHDRCPGHGVIGVGGNGPRLGLPIRSGRPMREMRPIERPNGFVCTCSCHRDGGSGVREPRRPMPFLGRAMAGRR